MRVEGVKITLLDQQLGISRPARDELMAEADGLRATQARTLIDKIAHQVGIGRGTAQRSM